MQLSSFASRRWLAPALVLAAAGAGALAAPAGAAECGNDAVRQQQGAERLPDCRAYEQVSPVDKNGGTIAAGLTARAEPGAVAFWSTGGFAGTQSNISSNYRALRTGDGWQTTALNPPLIGRNPVLVDQVYVAGLARDFSRSVLVSRYPFDPGDQAPGGGATDLYRTESGGGLTWISKPATLPDLSARALDFVAATDDLEQVVFNSFKALAPTVSASDTTQQVYVSDGETTHLVSVAPPGTLDGGGDPLPAGSPLPRGAAFGDGAASSTSGGIVGGSSPSALSDDGSTVYFATYRGISNPQLYVRVNALDPAHAETRVVTRSHVDGAPTGPACTATVNFLAANRDGSKAWFACPARLTDDAPARGGIYVYDRNADQLHFIAATADASTPAALGADPDVDHLWFTSRARLTDDADSSKLNIYVLRGETVSLAVSTSDPSFAPGGVMISPDGSRLVFEGKAALDSRAGSFAQVYSAQAGVSGVVCVSCRPDGSASEAIADLRNVTLSAFIGPSRARPVGAIDDDGRVFFTSADKLAPADENGTADVYQHRDGETTLISSGTDPGGAVFAGASADGTDVFFITAERLVPQDVDNGVADLYSARAGGGFLLPAQPPECEDDCQGTAPPRFTPPTLETGVFTGPDDVEEQASSHAPRLTVAAIGVAKRAAWARSGRTTLVVRATHAGRVQATATARIGRRTVRVAAASRTVADGASARLTLRLSRRARATLARQRALKVKVTVTHSRVAAAKRATVTLRKPTAKRTNGGKR